MILDDRLTDEQELLLMCWCQFAQYETGKFSNNGLSTLEDLQIYLTERGLIDKSGVPTGGDAIDNDSDAEFDTVNAKFKGAITL